MTITNACKKISNPTSKLLNIFKHMKNTLPTIAFTLIFSIQAALLLGQAQVPNGDFESWPPANNDNPEYWDSPNALTSGFPFFLTTVEKTSDSHTGSWAASVTTGTILGQTIPGVLSLGILDIDIENIENTEFIGLPFTDRPAVLEGYFKYSTPGTDFGLIGVLLTRYNEATANKDSIAFGIKEFTPQTDYTHFSAALQYLTLEEPDSINIVILSSASPTLVPGSQLKIDDLSFDYSGTPIVDLGDDVGICAGLSYTFELEYVESYTYTWINMDTGEVIGNSNTLTVSEAKTIQAVVQNAQGLPGFDEVQVFLYDDPGDANGDGIVNVLDVITITAYFVGQNPDPFCFENADVNQDGIINVLDVIGTVGIFTGN